MSRPLTGISSMATRLVLGELADAYAAKSGRSVAIESVGGVDAARRVMAGEAFDVVMLASDAIDKLIQGGHVRPGRVDLVRSPVAIAVRAGARAPKVDTEDALRDAVARARSVAYSTGPSGTHLVSLFDRWGLTDQVKSKTVQAPPGVPVGRLVAQGEAELGFQQLSELMHLDGIALLGTLPPGTEFITTFSAAIGRDTDQAGAVRELLAYLTSADAAASKRRHGMEPA
mgnify:FL=1